LVDAETKEVGYNENYIDSMKRIREDILEDYGLHYGEEFTDEKIKKLNAQYEHDIESKNSNWIRFRIVFINLVVSTSFLARFSMKGFYTMIILGISSFLKPMCMFSTFMGWLYEATHAMIFLKLIDAIYMGRHEKNLKQEEECWRMLQDIVRCPELVKAISGSNCKGACDP
jgi:hypothetical protein